MFRKLLFLLLASLALPAVAQPPVIGFIAIDAGKYYAEEQRYSPFATRVLYKNDFGFGMGEYELLFGAQANEQRTYDMLRQFNVTVIDTPFDHSITELGRARQAQAAAARHALERYLQEGGSALLLLQAVRYPNDLDQDFANLVIAGLGVQMVHEGVFDAQRAFQTPIASIFQPEGFFWTENIVKDHPVTANVKRLCLPQNHNGQTPGAVAFTLSPEWQVLARGEASAQSYKVTHDSVTDYNQVGMYQTAPPLVAARSFGKGRLVVYSVPARSVYTNYGVPGWSMIVEETGNAAANLLSDSGKLVLNALNWLAESSKGNPNLGTFAAQDTARVQFPQSLQYDDAQFEAPVPGVRGLFGAKTALSDGAGTVEQYAQAAKAAGLSFIVFNESLEKMTAAKLAQLQADCKRVSTEDFYACPGLEFSDEMGNRWAIWSDRLVFPQTEFKRAYIPTTAAMPALPMWDGQVLHNTGKYWELCGYSPNMLLTYRNLRAQQAHPANMWWFYRVAPYVFDRGKLTEDNFDEWLYALRDIRHVDPASYTRLYAPAEVAGAAATCVTAGRNLPNMRDWLNTRCANYGNPACPYVSTGPRIEQWEANNSQFDSPLDVRGAQRAHGRFTVASPDGIREVSIRDANYGVLRRYLGNGQPTLAREFELAHDRDHYLTLVVVDGKGKVAVSDEIYLWNYKTSMMRCGDNLNFLNGVGLCWHPDRNEMMPLAQMYQGMPAESIGGYDTAAALTSRGVLALSALDTSHTEELKQYPVPGSGVVLRKILDVKLPGRDVKICDMTMDPLVESYDTPKRDTPALCDVPTVVQENQLFVRTHRAYYLQNRNNMFVTWNYRRAREGAENYRGGLVWHEGKITFKRDATLAGAVPVPLFYLSPNQVEGTATVVLVQDSQGGPTIYPLTPGQPFAKEGLLAPGGFLTAGPCDTYPVIFGASGSTLRYNAFADPATGRVSQIVVGVGQAGQNVAAGESLPYRFAVASLGGPRKTSEEYVAQFEDLGESFGLGGGERGVKSTVSAGTLVSREVFYTLQAAAGEAACRIEPRATIIDLPFCVQGVEDNGCAAVFSSARPWFRPVGVAEGKAYFQENVDRGSEIWAGNVFLCDDKSVRLTLVADGLAEGRAPFLEVHNPTDKPITARVWSPQHAPLFGGYQSTPTLPAGSSLMLTLTKK
ncbi:MAG TPA: hypothetical protein VGM19_09595 [Armatimonadota bacterium]